MDKHMLTQKSRENVFKHCCLRGISVKIRWVLRSLIYCRQKFTQQVCFLNLKGVKLNPMTQAYCKIIQVWEKQGFGRTRQITWKSLKHSYLTLLPTWFSILMWKAIFLSLEIKLGLVQIQRILFHWYLSIFTCLRFLYFGLTSRSVFLNLGISIYMDFQMYWAVLKVCTAMRLHPHTCAKLCDSLLHRNV